MEYKKNSKLTVTITDIGISGEGIGKVDGYTLFVKDAVPGDQVEALITKAKKNYAYARCEKVLTPSPFRVQPPCACYRPCGGCQLQPVSYERQLLMKQEKVKNNLVRIGGFPEEMIERIMEPIVGMESSVEQGSSVRQKPGMELKSSEGLEPALEKSSSRYFDSAANRAAGENTDKKQNVDEFTQNERDIELEQNWDIEKNQAVQRGEGKTIDIDESGQTQLYYPLRYRNKAQYPVGTGKDGKPVAGFYAGRTHSIIENTGCLLGPESDEVILKAVLAFMEENNIPAYDEETRRGIVRHVLIRTGFTTGEVMVCLVINARSLPQSEKLVSRLRALEGEERDKGNRDACKSTGISTASASAKNAVRIKSICTSTNMENTNVIMGKEITLLYGEPFITDYIGDIKFRISPLSFFQVNPVQTKKLYETALEYADLSGSEIVWDLYCGIGTISLFLARKAGRVYGVEIIPEAIEDARQNAALNHIDNAEFFVGKAEEVLPEKYEKEQLHADVIIVDPPRKGCDNACLDTMLKMQPQRIVYVSCDSATLARDLAYLTAGGYTLEKVRPVDMFPMTVHVETVVCMSKKNSNKKDYVEIGVDAEDYHKIKEDKNN